MHIIIIVVFVVVFIIVVIVVLIIIDLGAAGLLRVVANICRGEVTLCSWYQRQIK